MPRTSPTARARRYDESGHVCSKVKVRSGTPPTTLATGEPTATALIRAVAHSGTRTVASYVNLAAGPSGHGSMERAWMAWHWLNMNGLSLPAVWAGGSHCSADDLGEVA